MLVSCPCLMYPFQRRRNLRWLIAAPLFALAAAGQLCAQAPADPLEAYLQKLGLADLRVRHLEHVAAGEQSREAKLAAGQKLADAYAERLMAVAEDEAAFKALKTRVDQLLAQMPEARTPALTVMLLQADFQRAESLINGWLESADHGAASERPHEAINTLTRIVPEFELRIKQINEAAERLLSREDDLMTTKSAKETEDEVFRLQSVAARATYFAGWGHYYLGLTQPTGGASSASFTAAKRHFSDVLAVDDDKDYEPVDADALGLESVWRARTAIGLGLAESALGNTDAAAACFRWLDHASAPANLRDEASYWQLKGLLNVRNYEEAAELGALKVAALAAPPTPGKNSFCTALIRAGAAPARVTDPAAHVAKGKLVLVGIAGLARLRQFDSLGRLVAEHKLHAVPAAKDSFYLTWLNGRAQFLSAEKTKRREDYAAAAATLEKALAQSSARQDLFAAGQCRYHLAWCKFRLEEFEAAAQAFREVTPLLKEGEEELAAQANWMEFAAWQSLAEKSNEPRHTSAAVSALETLKREFPGSEQAGKADIYIARMQQDLVPEKAIESLLRVKPGEPSYLAAQYEIVTLRHKIWKAAGGEKRADESLASEVLAAVDQYLSAAGSAARPDERLRAALMAIEVLSARSESEASEIERYLRRAQSAAQSLADSSPLLPEFQYRRLQHAQRTKNDAELDRAADWIAANAAGTPYELPALIIVARQADAAVDAASSGEKQARTQEAAAIYERLARLMGDTPEAIAGTKNALAVSSRLAAYDESLGRWKEAAARLDKIVAAYPSDKKYLRRAGIAHVQAGNFAAAADHWRTLLSGLKGGSDEWLEAKHYQITCLLETDPAAAQKVYKQFKLLYPEVKSTAWREKFAALEQRFIGK